ncbi:EAL domain-containing protein [uncultured Jatrophihabitans sp.]|uniref:EAL domain-containing protein n=1 Tax=uncultured Jatrophihabitans sp. TaxID=1610747 RepID=UPI0035CC33D2
MTALTPIDVDVTAVLRGLHVHLQPIVDVATGVPLAVEALARFAHAPGRPADEVFAEAYAAGYGYSLEAACLRAALDRRPDLPTGLRLAVNVSPDVLQHPVVTRGWDDDLSGVIVEVTEHRANHPGGLQRQFERLRQRGAKIAIDDVGTGYAGLLRLATMRPDYVKIDRTVITNVRRNPAQAAVLEALVAFSHRMGAAVIGEGVESLDDLAALADFDVDYAQGWVMGGPAPEVAEIARTIVEACQQARGTALERAAGAGAADAEHMHAMTSAMSSASTIVELHTATAQAAAELGVDRVGVSVLDLDGVLREITSSCAPIDTARYALVDYPSTRRVLETGNTAEVHLADPAADRAETLVLRRLDHASLLMVPLTVADKTIGVLELSSHRHRRWSSTDVAHSRGLAAHLGHALQRIRQPCLGA